LLTGIGSLLVAAGLVAVIASSNAQSPSMPNKSVPTRSELLEGPHSSEIITNKVTFELANLKDGANGKIEIELFPEWAPIGVRRFQALTRDSYWDGVSFFRVIPSFIAQFGLNGDPAITKKWQNNLKDDKVKHSNAAGTLTFATAGPGTRTTQLFFNLADNSFLDDQGFSPIGKIVQGMDLLDQIRNHPDAGGPDQGQVESEGDRYLDRFASIHNTEFTKVKIGKFSP
jgi:cyclophilin family peptidyl-prolyl cis-trans isomerase